MPNERMIALEVSRLTYRNGFSELDLFIHGFDLWGGPPSCLTEVVLYDFDAKSLRPFATVNGGLGWFLRASPDCETLAVDELPLTRGWVQDITRQSACTTYVPKCKELVS